jgi:hypothetical protein
MKFLHPNFLWALLFIAVPLIIHLFYFRRYKRVLFSNTKFLTEIKEEQATKNKLKHLLVLFARMLAVLFLVLAFAQPFIPSNKSNDSGEKLISIYLDNSFSMQTEGTGYLLFEEAKTSAQKIIEAYADNNKFHVLSNDFEAKHQRIVSKSEALNLLSEIRVSAASQNKAMVFEKQQIATKKFEGNKIFYQLSDFQKHNGLLEEDEEVQMNLISFEATALRNVSIDEVWFNAPVQLLGQNKKVLVKISNQSDEEQNGSYQLSLNGVAKSIGNYSIRANDYIIDTLQFTVNQDAWNKGKVSINDYPLTFDDNFYFTFFVEKALEVYCIYEGNGEKFPRAVFNGNTQVNYSSSSAGNVDFKKIEAQHLVVLSNLKNIPSGLSDALQTYVDLGGQVFVIPNNEASMLSYNQFLSGMSVGTFVQKSKDKRTVAQLNLQHELVSDIFDELPTNIDLPLVNEYFVLNRTPSQSGIMSFADGSNYLSSSTFGNGHIYILSSAIEPAYTNLSQQAIFAPITYKMAILGANGARSSFVIESNTNIILQELPKNSESLLRLKRDEVEIIPQKSIYNGRVNLSLPGDQLQAGYYEVSADEEAYKAEIALNFDRKESDLSFYDLNELKDFFANSSITVLANNMAAISENVKQLEDGRSFWKLCIILALVFLAIEILLLRFLPH